MILFAFALGANHRSAPCCLRRLLTSLATAFTFQSCLFCQQCFFFFDQDIDRCPDASDPIIDLVYPALGMESSAQGLPLGQLLGWDGGHRISSLHGHLSCFHSFKHEILSCEHHTASLPFNAASVSNCIHEQDIRVIASPCCRMILLSFSLPTVYMGPDSAVIFSEGSCPAHPWLPCAGSSLFSSFHAHNPSLLPCLCPRSRDRGLISFLVVCHNSSHVCAIVC